MLQGKHKPDLSAKPNQVNAGSYEGPKKTRYPEVGGTASSCHPKSVLGQVNLEDAIVTTLCPVSEPSKCLVGQRLRIWSRLSALSQVHFQGSAVQTTGLVALREVEGIIVVVDRPLTLDASGRPFILDLLLVQLVVALIVGAALMKNRSGQLRVPVSLTMDDKHVKIETIYFLTFDSRILSTSSSVLDSSS